MNSGHKQIQTDAYVKNLATFPEIAVVRMRVMHNQKGPYRSGEVVTDAARLRGRGERPARMR